MGNDVLQDVLAGKDPALSTPDSDQTNITAPGNGTPQEAAAVVPNNAMMEALQAAGIKAPLAPPPATPKSPTLDAIKTGSDQATEAQQKNGTATQPGAWARALVSGAQSALGKGGNISASLGDVAAIGELPKHTNALGGALTGIARTEAARTQRMSAEQNQQLATAKANIEMHHQQLLIQQLDEAMQEKHVAMDQQALSVLRTSQIPMETVGHNVTSKDIDAMLSAPQGSQNKINMGEYTAYQSGIGENGVPLFDIVKLPEKVSLDTRGFDTNKPEAKAEADRINAMADLIQEKTGKDFHGSEMSGADFNKYYTMAKTAEATDDARKETLEEAGLKSAKIHDQVAWTEISPVWSKALVGHETDPVTALETLEKQHPDLIKQYPNLPELVRKNYGEQYWEDRIKANQKEIASNKDTIAAVAGGDLSGIGDLSKAEAVESASALRLKDNPNDQEAQAAYRVSHATVLGTRADQIATKKAKDEADYNPEDIDLLTQGALAYNMDPNKWRGLPGLVREKVMANIVRQDPTWSDSNYEERRDTIRSFAVGGKNEQQVRSLNTFAGHAAQADKYIPELNNSNLPHWNMPMNKIGQEVGAEQYAIMRAKLAPVGKEYLTFLNANHAATKEDQQLVDKLMDENSSPKVIHGVIAAMADTIAQRGGQMQRDYMGVFDGKPNRQLLDPDANSVLKSWGIDTNKMNGIIVPRDGSGNAPLGKSVVNGIAVFQMKNGSFVNAIGQPVDPRTGKAVGANGANQNQNQNPQ